MGVDAYKEDFEHIELFGKPGLFTNARIDRDTLPDGWHCYDLRGSDYDPGKPITVEDQVFVNHAGTVLLPEPVQFEAGKDRCYIHDGLNFLGEDMTVKAFCEAHALKAPLFPRLYQPSPAYSNEAGLFYAMTPEEDEELGCIGHVRMDFGKNGKEFHHTWHPRGPVELNSPAFKSELDMVMTVLRRSVLKDLPAMSKYCCEHGGEIDGGWRQNYGYVIQTEQYGYYLRCSPGQGDYHAYLTCFDLHVQEMNQEKNLVGRLTFSTGETVGYTDADEFLMAFEKELAYGNYYGTKYELLTDDPQVRKGVDDVLYDLFGEENPRSLEDYKTPKPSQNTMTMGGM